MAAIVKPIEAKSVHQIQSGQVIVDLCSVVKELVENSLDAGANTLEVRFKNNGLDEIEVQDNGSGIAAINYDGVALKHYTSKLSTYDDLSTLQTFGFRGEALSSLCALSKFSVTTAQADEAPKGHRLEFEISGRLKGTSIVACQKGTTASVQNLFEKLPVRRKELSKNIKREYGKVLGLLHAYACISTGVKFTVKNTMPKGKSLTIFATKSNATTRENIANVYGAKTLSALVPLDLVFDFPQLSKQVGGDDFNLTKVTVQGHISKPVFGEGRQTPDRQMFFVNGRPCGLPQIAKAINEVYKSFNVSQSPFIFADLQMDTSAYDVNVSPDKRTIFLHNAAALTEGLKSSLTQLFDNQDQTVPQAQLKSSKLPAFKSLTVRREPSDDRSVNFHPDEPQDFEALHAVLPSSKDTDDVTDHSNRLLHAHFGEFASTREAADERPADKQLHGLRKDKERRAAKVAKHIQDQATSGSYVDVHDDDDDGQPLHLAVREKDLNDEISENEHVHVKDFNARMAELQNQQRSPKVSAPNNTSTTSEPPIPSLPPIPKSTSPGIVQDAFDRMRAKRLKPELATITIGGKTTTRLIGSQQSGMKTQFGTEVRSSKSSEPASAGKGVFARGLQKFSAPGVQPFDAHSMERVESDEDLEPVVQRRDGYRTQDEAADNANGETESSEREHMEESRPRHQSALHLEDADSDLPDEDEEKTAEQIRVSELIRQAEASSEQSEKSEKRVAQALKGVRAKDSVVSLGIKIELDLIELVKSCKSYKRETLLARQAADIDDNEENEVSETAEEQLSLTVSKSDFFQMRVVGQFNLGFILAVRNQNVDPSKAAKNNGDELFIIDQHASDEKFNFERLQAETVVSNQRMVRPVILDLTAVEEEIVIESANALEKNGFVVDIDTSGEQEVGKRCQLVSLPLSKEVVFGTKDLDELIHLLAESPMLNESSPVPRPSKVRKMFAMRACRSSIMIGRTLSRKQMTTVLQHMGGIDKPWNCPHGRPTMRHLASLNTFNDALWREGDGVYPGQDPCFSGRKSASAVWRSFVG